MDDVKDQGNLSEKEGGAKITVMWECTRRGGSGVMSDAAVDGSYPKSIFM